MKKDEQKIERVLTKGVEKILPGRKGLARLMKKRKIKLYLGIDPTSPQLHLGHTIPLRKLREFQELGHEVILLFGTFTAQIGDPSDREEKRKPLTPEQIKENMTTYKKQAAKILDTSNITIAHNAEWLAKLTFKDLIKLASHFTTSRLLERDMFQRRLKRGSEVWVSEFLYPLMQGYDSVAMNVDLEIGSTDQLFNMLVGRKLQRIYNKKEKFILTTPMLVGLDGKQMSKTAGNTVNIVDPPNEMYGKLMSLKDELIIPYFRLCTEVSKEKIQEIEKNLKTKKLNPRNAKAELAKQIVALYHGDKAAQEAEKEFERVFKEGKPPFDIQEVEVKKEKMGILDLLLKTKLASSKSEAKRLIQQGAVWVKYIHKGSVLGVPVPGVAEMRKEKQVTNWRKIIDIKTDKKTLWWIRVGKRRYRRVSLKNK